MENLEQDIEKHFFRPICSDTEIERIFNVQDGKDHLLKLRAETVVDNMRLLRVIRNKALWDESNWSLESSFSDSHYEAVLNKLSSEHKDICQEVTYGDVFSNDPNGMIFRTPFGPVTTISQSLDFFLKFAHLALLDFETEVPQHVRMNSLRIAIRVMLKTEAMDFYMDPRGIIPADVAEAIHEPIFLQKQFIAGHEFAHYFLGHLSDNKIKEQPVFFAISNQDDEYRPEVVYNPSQKDEFEADLHSIISPVYTEEERADILQAALLWFGCLELYEAVLDVIAPVSSSKYQTHPPARARYENLLKNVPTSVELQTEHWREFPKLLDNLIEFLQEDVAFNCDMYEQYGSVYLDKPNTLWRGKELIDREDYY